MKTKCSKCGIVFKAKWQRWVDDATVICPKCGEYAKINKQTPQSQVNVLDKLLGTNSNMRR